MVLLSISSALSQQPIRMMEMRTVFTFMGFNGFTVGNGLGNDKFLLGIFGSGIEHGKDGEGLSGWGRL